MIEMKVLISKCITKKNWDFSCIQRQDVGIKRFALVFAGLLYSVIGIFFQIWDGVAWQMFYACSEKNYDLAERGICAPTIFLWVLFITFEYAIRYRFDNTVAWYLSRTSGLLPSATGMLLILGFTGTFFLSPIT